MKIDERPTNKADSVRTFVQTIDHETFNSFVVSVVLRDRSKLLIRTKSPLFEARRVYSYAQEIDLISEISL